MDDFELQAHISAARRKVRGDTLHPVWDIIFDAEAILQGQRHICTRDEVEQDLRKFAPNPEPLLPEQVEYVKNLRRASP